MQRSFSLNDLTLVVPGKDAQSTVETTLTSLVPALRGGASCVLVNDGSEDTTGDIMDRFAQQWPNAEVIHLETAHGAGPARNLGLEKTKTRLFASVDSDDWVSATYHSRLVDLFNRDPEVDFVRSHYLECRGNERKLVRAPFDITSTPFDPKLAVLPDGGATMVDHPQIWAGVYATDFLNDNGIRYDDLHTAEDRIFNWKTQLLGRKMIVADEVGFFYRRDHTISLTAVGDDRQLDFLQAMENVVVFLLSNDLHVFLPKAMRQVLALICFHTARKSRLLPETWEKLQKGSRRLLLLLPREELEQALSRMDADRQRTIEGMMQ